MSIVNYSGVLTYDCLVEFYENGRDCNRRINYLLLTEILEEKDNTGSEFYLITVFQKVLRGDIVVSKVFLQEVSKVFLQEVIKN